MKAQAEGAHDGYISGCIKRSNRKACLKRESVECRLKLRELLMPQVVSQVEGSNPNVRAANSNGYRSWKVNPDLFPCDLSQSLQKQADDAVQVGTYLTILTVIVADVVASLLFLLSLLVIAATVSV